MKYKNPMYSLKWELETQPTGGFAAILGYLFFIDEIDALNGFHGLGYFGEDDYPFMREYFIRNCYDIWYSDEFYNKLVGVPVQLHLFNIEGFSKVWENNDIKKYGFNKRMRIWQ